MNRSKWAVVAFGVLVMAQATGCRQDDVSDEGTALVTVSALQLRDVVSVSVTVQSAALHDQLVVPLVKAGGQFSAIVSSLPVGTDYSFTASAKDAANTELYRGSANNQTIVKNKTASITINMNQVAPGVALENCAPVVDSLSATALAVSYGEAVMISASAHDPDVGETALMRWSWATTCGVLGTPVTTVGTDSVHGTSAVVFTSPAADGPCTVTVRVTDANGILQNVVSVTIQVSAATGTGNAKITANLDTYPIVSGLNATPVPLKVGSETGLSVTATDPDGDALNYLWSSPDCTGTFGNTKSATTTFTLSAMPSDLKCTFVARVDDGTFPDGTAKGGVITNQLVLPVASPASTVVGAPAFGFDYQSKDTISGGDVVSLAIVARQGCPDGTISLQWAASDNTALGRTTPAAIGLDPELFNSSAVTYTAQPGAEYGDAVTITVTAACSSTQQSATHVFTLTPASRFCYGAATIAPGWYHSCALKADRSLWCWGMNQNGALGDGTMNNRWVPLNVVAVGRVLKAAGGAEHTCALKADQTLWCWGLNGGALGDGTTADRLSPVQVPLGNSVADVASGFFTCARKTDGSLWCWGTNFYGSLGDGTATNRYSPVQVATLGNSVVDVAVPVTGYHACALKSDGTLWCWGFNTSGQLGDGTTAQRNAPVQVVALGDSVVDVSTGSGQTCARRRDGTLWCWGNNESGQLGDGTTTQRLTPVQVTALGSTVAQVAAGENHTCARKTDGTLWCWGINALGQLGEGTWTPKRLLPVQVTALGNTVVDVAVGANQTCARKSDGTLWCWGWNAMGQLGDGTNIDRPSPVQVSGFAAQEAPICRE